MRKLLAVVMLVGFVVIGQGTAYGVPILQLYMEGAYYDATTESWVYDPAVAGAGPMRLWTIGNIWGPGGRGTISQVRLSASYDSSYSPVIELTPTVAGGVADLNGYGKYGTFVDGE